MIKCFQETKQESVSENANMDNPGSGVAKTKEYETHTLVFK